MSPPSAYAASSRSPVQSTHQYHPLHQKNNNNNNHSIRTPSNHHDEEYQPTSFWSYLLSNLTDPCCGTSAWMYHEQDEQDDDDDLSVSLASTTETENAVHNYKNYDFNHRMASF